MLPVKIELMCDRNHWLLWGILKPSPVNSPDEPGAPVSSHGCRLVAIPHCGDGAIATLGPKATAHWP